uniref:MYB family transcription factor n=1 Tax=Melilotus albus TaxID=47082 RepID=A0A896WCG5_MELAB|nr:MYB family transcription factor [Melilotus albus]
MSLEPIPLDRKSSSLRERKQGSSESSGSVARWRGSSSSHNHRRLHEFNRSGDHQRLGGHRRMGSWQLFPEESGHENVFSRSCDNKLGEDNCRPSFSRGDGKYGRGNRESRGTFSQREWRGHSSENVNNSLNMSRRQTDASNDRKSVDDMLTYSSRPNSDIVNNWEQHHMKDQHNKRGGVNRFGTSQRCDRDSSLGTIDWKPLKWTRPGSSRDSGFSRSSGMRSLGGTNLMGSCEGKVGLRQKFATAVESNSEEAAICRTSSAPSEETNSRKKPRLNWGEGLAKFEKKQVEGPEVTSNKDDPLSPPFNMEPSNFLSPGLVDKSPKVLGLAGCASPTTLSPAIFNSSPGVDDKLFGKAAIVDRDVDNSGSSPGPGSQSHMQMFSFNLEKVDNDSLTKLGSSLVDLLPQFDNLSSVDCSLLSSTTMNKLMILKADISKVLEVTETEIDSLETELRSLKSKSEGRLPCTTPIGPLRCCNAKSCDKYVGDSDKVARVESLQIVSSGELIVEKMPFSDNLLDSPGPPRSKIVEDLPMISAVSACDVGRYGTCSEDLDRIQSTSVQCLIPCTYRHGANVNNSSLEVKDGVDAKSSASFYSSTDDILYDTIISCNKRTAKEAHEVFDKLLSEKYHKNDNIGTSSGSCSLNDTHIMERFAERRRMIRLKERVITLKFKALNHLWKEDTRLLSTRKHRPKSHKKLESDLHTTINSHQKKRSTFRFPFPAGNKLRLVPTSEMVKYTSQLLSESKHDIHRSTLKMPALILDQKEKMNSMFLSSNGLVEDPLAIEKERAMINPWTSEEKEIFLEKFAAFGKDFRKISTFLGHKTTADCVEFYYKNHKSDCFEEIKKKGADKLAKFLKAKTDLMESGIKWNSEANTSNLDILSAVSVMADGHAHNRKMRSGRSLWRGYDHKAMSKGDSVSTEKANSSNIIEGERETVAAAGVLTGICGGCPLSEAAGSSITSLADPVKGKRVRKSVKGRSKSKQPPMAAITQDIDPETCSDESCGEMELTDWTDVEKAAFLHALSSFGKDFAVIAQCVGTRSQYQCKVFFCKTHKRIGMDLIGHTPENVGALVNDDVDGSRSDTDNACIAETGSANGSDTSGSKTGADQPASDKNMYRDESNPVDARNLSAELDESEGINGEVDHRDVNIVSNASLIGGESQLATVDNEGVLYSSDRFGSVRHQSAIIMPDSIEIGNDKPSEGGGVVTDLVSDMRTIEACYSNSAAEGRLVPDVSSGHQGNELVGSAVCRDEADTDVVIEFKDNVHGSRTSVNTSLPLLEASCSRLSVDAENESQLCLEKPQFSGLSEGPVTNANDVKIFGKVLTIPSSTQKPTLSAKGNEENGNEIQPVFPSLPDFNAPYVSCSDGNTVQPASSILLAKYPLAFGCYPGGSKSSNTDQLVDQTRIVMKEDKCLAEKDDIGS